MSRLEKALEIIETRTSASICTRKCPEGIQFLFVFDDFTVEFIIDPDGFKFDTQFARAVLNKLEHQVIHRFVDNGNFCDGFHDLVPGIFGKDGKEETR